MASRGKITLVTGSMFSGKSSELIRQIRRYEQAQRRCLLLKYCHDTRYSKDCVSTHDKQMLFATSCARLAEVGDLWQGYDVIGVDEGQFFPDLISFCETAANAGKIVIVAALDGTFQRKPFGDVCNLLPLSEDFTKFTAVCHSCGGDAPFSKRLTADTAVELIGGEDMYVPMCRPCFTGTPSKGSIHITLGPMFSGKSSDLLRRIRRFRHARKKCLLVKYNQDCRYSESCVSTHDKVLEEAVPCGSLSDLGTSWLDYDVIGIDEGQFFPDLIPFCDAAADAGKAVIIAALDGTFQRKPFQSVCDLVALADSVTKLSAICTTCRCEAAFSLRLTAETSPILIGGSEAYVPSCRGCFHEHAALPAPETPLDTPVKTHVCDVTGSSVPVSEGSEGDSPASPDRALSESDTDAVPFELEV